MQVATRWTTGRSIAAVFVLFLSSNVRVERYTVRKGDPWKPASPVVQLGRCADSASPAIQSVNHDYDTCVARYFYEIRGVARVDGRFAFITASDSWLRVCADPSMCSKSSTPDVHVEAWRAWDTRRMFMGAVLPCVSVYDGAARLRRGDDGWPEEIETAVGTELDGCMTRMSEGPVIAGATDD